MAEFNATYALVNEAGKSLIYAERTDPVLKRRYFDRIHCPDFKLMHQNRQVVVAEDDGGGKLKYAKAAGVWLNSRSRRQCLEGVVFDPSEGAGPGYLNLWRGFAVKPAPGNWSLMREHIRIVLCRKDGASFDYTMNWLARLAQRPAELGHVAVVLRGLEGAGKGIFGRALVYICGQHGLQITNRESSGGPLQPTLARPRSHFRR